MFKNFRTIEFRLHTPTTNRYKVFNWLLICSSIVKYATDHVGHILETNNITLNDILLTSIEGKRLTEYINLRKSTSYNKDVRGDIEFSEDKNYLEKEYA
jgi:hypothetical protein